MKNWIKLNLLGLVLLSVLTSQAQVAVSTDGSSADASAMLEVKSTDKGMLIPRMTSTQRENISNPANGLLVFVTSDNSFYYYNGSSWEKLVSNSEASTDGDWTISGNNIYSSVSGNVGIGTDLPDSKLHINDGCILVGGTNGGTPVSGTGTRFMWIPEKRALRAGQIENDTWDNNNIGYYSAAVGYNTKANGYASVASGSNTTASGDYTIASGSGTLASGNYSTAMNHDTEASGYYSTAFGNNTTASGYYSFAIGNNSIASGLNSTALGEYTEATAENSIAIGNQTNATGIRSFSMGFYTTASGTNSTVFGTETTAQAYSSFVIGRDNIVTGNQTNWVSTDPLFVIGNGTYPVLSNALTVLKNGNTGIGEENPQYSLDVIGDINFSGNLRQNGSIVNMSGLTLPYSGSYNTLNGSVFHITNTNYGQAISVSSPSTGFLADVGPGGTSTGLLVEEGAYYGVFVNTPSTGGKAGYFNGNVEITGTLSKGGGSFKIDHPLDPENKYLYHSFVESPDMMNVYNGNTKTDENGIAIITMPEYFQALNRDFRYQLTCIETFANAIVSKKISNNSFTIQTDKPSVEVSWQVTGIRKDPFAENHRIEVEVYKEKENRGKYIHPVEYGKSVKNSINTINNK